MLMNYKEQIRRTMRYYDTGIRIHNNEIIEEKNDIEEIDKILEETKIEISELRKQLDMMEETREDYIESYITNYNLLKNKEDKKRILRSDKIGSINAIKRLNNKINTINLKKKNLNGFIC